MSSKTLSFLSLLSHKGDAHQAKSEQGSLRALAKTYMSDAHHDPTALQL